MADLTTSSAIDTFMQSANQATARTALGLGTAATQASGAFATAAQGALADTATQPGSLGNAAAKNIGTTAGTVAAGDDSRLSDSRTPTAHATSHKSGGSDAIKLDELAAPTDITTLNATTSAHGLLPKLGGGTTNFLRADGSWAAPSGGGGSSPTGPAGGSLSGTYPDPTVLKVGASNTTVTAFGETVAGAADQAAGRTALGLGGASTLAVGTAAGTVAAGDDSRFTNARTPTAHASTHVNGTDDILSATASQKGLATAAQISKLDGIEALADVTDAGNVGSSINGASAVTTLNDTDKVPVTVAGTLSNIAYSALKTLLNAIYALKGAATGSGLTMATGKLLGRGTASTGAIEEITLGTNLSLSGTTLNAAGGGGGGLTNVTETLHTASPNNTVNAEQLEVTGGTTNTDLVLTPKGTGAFIIGNEPDSGTTGGNKRGANSFDSQTLRVAATQVASGLGAAIVAGARNTGSGDYSFIAGFGNTASSANAVSFGTTNTASGNSSAAIGNGNTASGVSSMAVGQTNSATLQGSFAHGNYGSADGYGMYAHASWYFSTAGDGQFIRQVLQCKTTTNSAVEMLARAGVTSSRLFCPAGYVLSCLINISGVKSDGSAVAHYVRQFSLKNVGGTTAQIYAPVTIGTDNAAGTSISVTADDTNDSLLIQPTGVTSETWRWVAVVEAIRIAYGT